MMSIDGQLYPIEEKICALVFHLNCLRVCPPYWSCEGHAFESGEIFRVPQVWFYSRSLVYPKLIGEHIFNLFANHRIENPWHVCITYSDDSFETGFSIEPDLKLIQDLKLQSLQSDVQVIASRLVPNMQLLAREYLEKYGQ